MVIAAAICVDATVRVLAVADHEVVGLLVAAGRSCVQGVLLVACCRLLLFGFKLLKRLCVVVCVLLLCSIVCLLLCVVIYGVCYYRCYLSIALYLA